MRRPFFRSVGTKRTLPRLAARAEQMALIHFEELRENIPGFEDCLEELADPDSAYEIGTKVSTFDLIVHYLR